MKKKEKRLLIYLLFFLLTMTGCNQTEECSHTFGALQKAVPAGFFAEGNIAYYRCADCGRLFDEEKKQVESIAVPVRSADLSVCINGEPIHLTKTQQSPEQIQWSSEKMRLSKGDVMTVCDAQGYNLTYVGEGNLSEDGTVRTSALEADVSLTATPEGLVLSVSEDTYPGVLAEINEERYPMHPISHDAYVYGYVELKAGDRFAVVDNLTGRTYGSADLAASCLWNRYDFHVGENGELVIARDGRYQVKLSKDGKISVTKVFSPRAGSEYRIVLCNDKPETVTMQALQHTSMQWDAFKQNAAHEYVENSADIAAAIASNDTHTYSSVLQLKEGTRFYLENAGTAEKITSEHVTQVLGSSGCVEQDGDVVRIIQGGVYYIQYLPVCDSIWIEQISAGDFKDAAAQLDREIVLLPSGVEQYYANEIKSLYEKYLVLSPYVKYRLKASGKLEMLHRNVLKLESAPAKVTYYMNTDSTSQVYLSKEALFRAFYTDYYYYIAVYHGTDALKTRGVKSLSDFLTLAQDLNGAGSTNLSGFGYVANKYFLISSSNNILENQPDDAFLGFCYQNGLYEELLPFLLRFFAYWRIDEHYATPSNHGADPFKEPWATTVDIAKFFYYNEETSYVKTERVLDCQKNAASVIYGFDETRELPQIRLRGYIFEGWYDNPEYSGSSVSCVDSNSENTRLYAKWVPDTMQRDADAASMVDIYIYNLTTRPALKTKTTVGYVKAMYDALSDQGKSLVKEIHTLQGLIKQFQLDSEN